MWRKLPDFEAEKNSQNLVMSLAVMVVSAPKGTLPQNESGREKSGKKKEHKLKLLGPDIFRWGDRLPREGVGAKKFGMSF